MSITMCGDKVEVHKVFGLVCKKGMAILNGRTAQLMITDIGDPTNRVEKVILIVVLSRRLVGA